jgi:hypothetical protein
MSNIEEEKKLFMKIKSSKEHPEDLIVITFSIIKLLQELQLLTMVSDCKEFDKSRNGYIKNRIKLVNDNLEALRNERHSKFSI